jgi:hypothetical protein
MLTSDDELVQNMQFISYLLVFGTSLNYEGLTPMEKMTADRLLRMGVLVEVGEEDRSIMLAKPWKKAVEGMRRKTG